MKNKTIFSIIAIIAVLIGSFFLLQNKKMANTEKPFHKPLGNNCNWVRREFPISRISFYEEKCPSSAAELPTYFEGGDGKIMGTNPSFIGGKPYLVMEVLSKNPNQTPPQIMEQWLNKLNAKQKNDCSIQDANRIQDQYSGEAPYKVDHKERYEIYPKSELIKSIIDKLDGLPGDSAYDYLCGKEVGSGFEFSSPYFEFDDRSPSKYLFVHLSWNDQGPNIDLNTIRF